MHWVLAFVGAFVGAAMGGADASVLGLFAGALIGWQGVRLAQLRERVESLEQAGKPMPRLPVAPPRVAPVVAPVVAPRAVDEVASVATHVPLPDAFSAAVASPAAGIDPLASPGPAAAAPPPMPQRAQAPVAPRAVVRAPQGPDWFERVSAVARRWLFEGNVPVKLGMLVLFFGVAAGLKYAVDQGYFSLPIEFRLGAIALGAIGGLVWGWRNRTLRPAFGLSLQGGAIGVLLLTVFAAFGLYRLLPAGIAFGLVLVLVAGAAMLAVLQDAVWLAVLGFIGGYLAPVLISTGSGNHVALFSYYAILNAAVFAIAWKRPWRALNLIGFIFTFVVGLAWGDRYYEPRHFATVEPFLILFFLFYVAIAVLYALRSPDERRPVVDGTLVFGTPLLAFPLQAALLGDDRMGLAFSALAVALLYSVLGVWLVRRRGHVLLGQSFAALAVGFATLAVPLALSARWTSASWALEGAALVWLGLRQSRRLPQFAGWALQALAACAYAFGLFEHGWDREPGEWAVLNGHALGVVAMSLSAFFISWLVERERGARLLVWLAFALGIFWWFVAGVRELSEHFSTLDLPLGLVALTAVTAALAGALRGLLRWPRLGWIVLGVAALGPVLVLFQQLDAPGAIARTSQFGWVAWFGAMLFALQRLREPEQRGLSLAHVAVLGTAAWHYGAWLHQLAVNAALDDGWVFVAGLLPMLALATVIWRLPRLATWPLADRFERYASRWLVPACAVLVLAWISALGARGGAAPLPFVPLINPVELFQLALLLVAFHLSRAAGVAADPFRPALAIAAFAFVTFAGLRGVHHATGAPWSISLLDDRIAQAVLTVLWSILGVAAWIYGSRRRLWNVWLAGAILMGVVLAKLVLVDRQYVGNLAGIVSFMAVGALLVLVGRIAPTPPRQRSAAAPTSESVE